MRDKLWVPKSQGFYGLCWLLKMTTGGLWLKRFTQISPHVHICALIVQYERHWQQKRPRQNVVIFTMEKPDIQRDVFALCCSISIEEDGQACLVTKLRSVKWRTLELFIVCVDCIDEL